MLSEDLQVCSAHDMQYLEGMCHFSPEELQEALDTIRKIFAEAGLEHLLTDPDALKAQCKPFWAVFSKKNEGSR